MLSTLILLLATALAGPNQASTVEAKRTFIETNLKVGMRVQGLQYKEWRSGFFKEKKNSVHPINFTAFAHAANGRYTESKSLDYNLLVNVQLQKSSDDGAIEYQKAMDVYNERMKEARENGKGCRDCSMFKPIDFFNEPSQKHNLRKLRTTNLNIQYSEGTDATSIKLSLTDNQKHGKWVIGGGENRTDLDASNDELRGNIRVGYRLPENSWGVVIQRKNRTGVFNLPQVDSGFQNAFNSNLPLKGDEKYIVWGKPGSDVYQEFTFNSYSQGSNVEGSFEVIATPIDLSDVQSKSIDQITKYLFSIEPYRSQVSFETHLRNIKHYLVLISRPDLRELAMNSLTTNQIIQLVTKMSDIAYSYEPFAWMWDLKATSTILSHELALLFLKQIVPFCRDEKIILPYTKNETQILGLKLANFFLEKSKMRLEYEHFKHYDTLLKLLSSYNGKTFAQVRSNASEVLKIKKAYDVLTNTVNMRFSAFKAAHDEIKFIYDKFGSLGAPGSDNTVIFDLIKSINGKDSEFNAELLSFMRLFQENNNSVVSTRGLISKLNTIKATQKSVVAQIDSKIKIAGFTPSDSGATFIQSVQAMTIHNVDILTQPLNSTFEPFRQSYFKPENVNPVISQIQGCVR